MQLRAAEQGHTSRGFSGALHLKSATAGVDPSFEGVTQTDLRRVPAVLTSGSRAIGSCEPCQVGNQAALSGEPDVPRGRLL